MDEAVVENVFTGGFDELHEDKVHKRIVCEDFPKKLGRHLSNSSSRTVPKTGFGREDNKVVVVGKATFRQKNLRSSSLHRTHVTSVIRWPFSRNS